MVSTRRPSAWRTSSNAVSFAGAATDSNGPSPSSAANAYRHSSRSWSQCQSGSRTRNQYVTPSTSRRSAAPVAAPQRSSRPSDSSNRLCASSPAANHGRIETTSDRSPGSGVQAGSRTTVDCPGIGGGASAADATKSSRVRRSSTGRVAFRAGSDWLVGACIVPECPTFAVALPPGTGKESSHRASTSRCISLVAAAGKPLSRCAWLRARRARAQGFGPVPADPGSSRPAPSSVPRRVTPIRVPAEPRRSDRRRCGDLRRDPDRPRPFRGGRRRRLRTTDRVGRPAPAGGSVRRPGIYPCR